MTIRHSAGRHRTRLQALVLGLLLAPLTLLAQDQAPPPELAALEAWIEQGMRDWGIPGLAVSVVKDDTVIWARGYGVRQLGHAHAVDADTLFNVASVSKAFNAAALALLVDEGRIGWDDPVIDHIPGFRLHDAQATTQATIRDLLAHRVGLGRLTGNRLRWISARPRAEQIQRLRHLTPERGFREGYVYSNVLSMIAGEVVPATTGTAWEDFVRARLFAPLGMHRSVAAYAQLPAGAQNLAFPHQEIDGVVVGIDRRDFDAVGPAASVHTSAREIAAWMRLHLGDAGSIDGSRLISAEAMAQMHQPQVLVPGERHAPVGAYGLGWQIGRFRDRHVSSHGGAVDGMNSLITLVPEESLGIFVTTNNFNGFTTALTRQVIDTVLGIDGTDWHADLFARHQARKARVQADRDAIHAARQAGTRPSAPLADFQGRYDDALYADARVQLEDGQLVLRLWDDPLQVADLEHWHHDTFRAIWRNRAMREEFVWFSRGRDGGIDRLHIDWVLRPDLLQVGAYPASYRREAVFERSR